MTAEKFIAFLCLAVAFEGVSKAAAAPNAPVQKQNYNLSLTEDFKALRNDAQWFFQHVEMIADTLVQILPVINYKEGSSRALSDVTSNSTFMENTRLTLLLGLRHLLVGIKEISVALQRRLTGDHVQQVQHLKTIVQILQDIIRFAKNWLSMLRNSLYEVFRVYNHYIPEILLGKCFGKYITNSYPDRSFYEYPFILFSELIDFGVAYLQSLQLYNEAVTESPLPTFIPEDISDEQNEIWPSSLDKYTKRINSTNIDYKDQQRSADGAEHPWQKCLKLYAADTISRQLKLFFIGD